MATVKPQIFTLDVYARGVLTKTLRNDTGKMPFGIINKMAGISETFQDAIDNPTLDVFDELKDVLAPILYETFAEYEDGDIEGVDLSDLLNFVMQFTSYMHGQFNRGGEAKNRQGVAPKK
jgi:hypothetical protein